MNSLLENSHIRKNILTGEEVLVSPHRNKRPWQGQQEVVSKIKRPSHDKSCYLCAGNTRANGETNPNYKDTFVFTNDFAALQKESKEFTLDNGLLKAHSERGICKVICFSADHSKSLAEMPVDEIVKVVAVWKKEYESLRQEEIINYVQIFENKGAVMGCSNPHPHGQIWSQSSIPNEVIKKDTHQKEYFLKNKRTLLTDYLKQELDESERIIFQNEAFVVLTPFWAVWPFEAMILPKKPQKDISVLSEINLQNRPVPSAL